MPLLNRRLATLLRACLLPVVWFLSREFLKRLRRQLYWSWTWCHFIILILWTRHALATSVRSHTGNIKRKTKKYFAFFLRVQFYCSHFYPNFPTSVRETGRNIYCMVFNIAVHSVVWLTCTLYSLTCFDIAQCKEGWLVVSQVCIHQVL